MKYKHIRLNEATNSYEWAKRMKILLAVIYRSPRQHSNNSKSLKLIHIFMITSGLVESFKTLNWPDLTRTHRDAFWRFIYQKVFKIRKSNFDTILNKLSNLCYSNLVSISLIAWKLWVFWHRSNFGYFQQICFIITFDWKENLNSDGLSERSIVPIYQSQPCIKC